MEQKHFHFNEKKRVVVKIGSSSLNYGETGNLNFTKLEHLVRELCNLRNRGMDVCLVSSGAIAVGRQTLGMDERPKDISTKQACAAVGAADDDLSAAFCGIQSGGRAGADDEEHDGEPCLERECEEYVRRIVPSWRNPNCE